MSYAEFIGATVIVYVIGGCIASAVADYSMMMRPREESRSVPLGVGLVWPVALVFLAVRAVYRAARFAVKTW